MIGLNYYLVEDEDPLLEDFFADDFLLPDVEEPLDFLLAPFFADDLAEEPPDDFFADDFVEPPLLDDFEPPDDFDPDLVPDFLLPEDLEPEDFDDVDFDPLELLVAIRCLFSFFGLSVSRHHKILCCMLSCGLD
jgi:hypothetical protein